MSRAVIADRSRLSWLALRRRLNILKGRAIVHPLAALVYWLLLSGTDINFPNISPAGAVRGT